MWCDDTLTLLETRHMRVRSPQVARYLLRTRGVEDDKTRAYHKDLMKAKQEEALVCAAEYALASDNSQVLAFALPCAYTCKPMRRESVSVEINDLSALVWCGTCRASARLSVPSPNCIRMA